MKIEQGFVAFITGGCSGLGLATVQLLHEQGASIFVADRDDYLFDELREKYKKRLFCMECDVSREEDVKAAIDKAVEIYGTIHAAIACAGITALTPTLSSRGSVDMRAFEQVLRVNLIGSVLVAKHAAIVMSKNTPVNDERGVILFVGSVQSDEGARAQTAYSASKGGIEGMVLPMARDLGKYKIRVLSIKAGLFETPMTSAMTPKTQKANLS